jgi:cbb3-type cytochrome c oxidase subunit III
MRSAFLFLSLTPMLSAQTNPFAGNQAAIDVGKGNFRLYCSPCHGIHAQGGRGPDLTRATFNAGDSDSDLFRVIAKGVEGTEMTSYAERFDDAMIWRFVAFIRSVGHTSTMSVPGDAQRGREIFLGKGGCAGCHATDGKATGIGPSLAL